MLTLAGGLTGLGACSQSDKQQIPADRIPLADFETVEVKTFNRWTEVRKTFQLPATVLPTQELRGYLWRTGGSQSMDPDDLELTRN